MIKINVCVGSACHIKGSYNIINTFQQLIESNKLNDSVEVNAMFCLGHCTEAVSVKIDDGDVHSVSSSNIKEFFSKYIINTIN